MKKIAEFCIILVLVILFNFSIKVETSGENNKTENENVIEVNEVGIDLFTEVTFIDNANYFKVNPLHCDPDGYNVNGSCTTVAINE